MSFGPWARQLLWVDAENSSLLQLEMRVDESGIYDPYKHCNKQKETIKAAEELQSWVTALCGFIMVPGAQTMSVCFHEFLPLGHGQLIYTLFPKKANQP